MSCVANKSRDAKLRNDRRRNECTEGSPANVAYGSGGRVSRGVGNTSMQVLQEYVDHDCLTLIEKVFGKKFV